MQFAQFFTSELHLVRLLRWTARISSILSIAMLSTFLFGEPGTPTLNEWVALLMFPAGVVAGMVIGWWRELPGGMLSMLSLALFYGWMTLLAGHPPRGPYFALFAIPGFIFLLCGLIERHHAGRHAGAPSGTCSSSQS